MKSGKLIIVYFIFIEEKSNWRKIISGQINDLKKFGLLQNAELHIQLTDTTGKNESENFIKKILPHVAMNVYKENLFEYHAIKAIYALALKNPGSILLYLHTKGMSYKIQSRARIEKMLTHLTFKNWREITSFLQNNPEINKAGLVPYFMGKHFWFNFWYAKADYIATLENPEINENRFYYEWWLGSTTGQNQTYPDAFSIFSQSTDFEGYDQMGAAKLMMKLIDERYKAEIYFEKKTAKIKKFWRRCLNFMKRKLKINKQSHEK